MNTNPFADDAEPGTTGEVTFRPVVEHVTVADENRLHKWLIAILFPYAIMMTVFAIVFYFKSRNVEDIHPLMMIPDLDGEYRNATQRKKVSGTQHRIRFPAEMPLRREQITSLGQSIRVGVLDVTPVSISAAPIVGYSWRKNMAEPERKQSTAPGLILKLKVKNISEDVTLYPSDPYFVRRPRDAKDRPYMMVEVGDRKFYGGALSYVTDSDMLIREWVEGQENDDKPLGPGEERETVVGTSPMEPVIDAVKESGSALWRVQLRRGFITFRDKEYSVSAVIGVRFQSDDVQVPPAADKNS